MMRTSKWCVAAIATLLWACEPAVENGSITGKITHETDGTAVVGATVKTEPATATATTASDGKYTLAEVPPGTYKLIVSGEGMVTRERANVVVGDGATVTLDFALAAATGTAKLTVKDACAADGPLAGATVTREGAAAVTTDSAGVVSLADLMPGTYALRVTSAAYLPVTVNVTVVAGQTAEVDAVVTCQRKIVADAARAFLATGGFLPTSASALHDKLYDTDNTNDPKVISVRAAADYAVAHIPGAINIPWKTVADEANLAKLGDPAANPNGYVDYCYTGHTGGIAAGVLNLLGYKTVNMKYGMAVWTQATKDANGAAISVYPDMTKDFATTQTPTTATQTFTPPAMTFTGVETPKDVIKAAARAYLSNTAIAATIGAQQLFDNLNDGNTANDPFIISVRSAADYAKGHIPGAVNIPLAQLATEENLAKIPTDRELVVYCYTGHTGAVATGILGTLGYHKVKNLKYGMAGWTLDTTVRATTVFNPSTDPHDYTVNTGTDP